MSDEIEHKAKVLTDEEIREGRSSAYTYIDFNQKPKRMSDKEFCKMHTSYYGEEIDNINQIAFISFSGQELKEYVEHFLENQKPTNDE